MRTPLGLIDRTTALVSDDAALQPANPPDADSAKRSPARYLWAMLIARSGKVGYKPNLDTSRNRPQLQAEQIAGRTTVTRSEPTLSST